MVTATWGLGKNAAVMEMFPNSMVAWEWYPVVYVQCEPSNSKKINSRKISRDQHLLYWVSVK